MRYELSPRHPEAHLSGAALMLPAWIPGMRAPWQEYGRSGTGVPDDGVERAAAAGSGLDPGELHDGALRSTRELDPAGPLAAFGLRLRWEAPGADATFAPHAAMTFRAEGELTRVQQVHADGPARRAGIAPGPEIAARRSAWLGEPA